MKDPWWTDERIATLQRMAAEGRSARQISDEIGTTRNTVIGKATRAKIRLKGKGGRKRQGCRESKGGNVVRMPERASAPVEDVKPKERRSGEPRYLANLAPSMCRWPLWSHQGRPDEPRVFCAGQKHGEGSYCREHARMSVKQEGVA